MNYHPTFLYYLLFSCFFNDFIRFTFPSQPTLPPPPFKHLWVFDRSSHRRPELLLTPKKKWFFTRVYNFGLLPRPRSQSTTTGYGFGWRKFLNSGPRVGSVFVTGVTNFHHLLPLVTLLLFIYLSWGSLLFSLFFMVKKFEEEFFVLNQNTYINIRKLLQKKACVIIVKLSKRHLPGHLEKYDLRYPSSIEIVYLGLSVFQNRIHRPTYFRRYLTSHP